MSVCTDLTDNEPKFCVYISVWTERNEQILILKAVQMKRSAGFHHRSMVGFDRPTIGRPVARRWFDHFENPSISRLNEL